MFGCQLLCQHIISFLKRTFTEISLLSVEKTDCLLVFDADAADLFTVAAAAAAAARSSQGSNRTAATLLLLLLRRFKSALKSAKHLDNLTIFRTQV